MGGNFFLVMWQVELFEEMPGLEGLMRKIQYFKPR
jgi:hypothetical protein